MADNYMQRVNPNLIIGLHYASKALWLLLAASFGVIGYQLYALGVQSVGNARVNLLGISFTLDNAGPGLVVMVMALSCSLIGAVRSKVELTPEAIRIMAAREDRRRGSADDDHDSDPGVGDRISAPETVLGLREIAQLYRTPLADLVGEEEAMEIARLQIRSPQPQGWADDVSSIVRSSSRFEDWLRSLPSRDLGTRRDGNRWLDSTLPWYVRLRWGSRVTNSVDLFVHGTIRTEPPTKWRDR